MKKSLITLLLGVFSLAAIGQDSPAIDKKYTKEIDKLVKDDKVSKAFQIILDENDINRTNLIGLTQTPAPPFNETARARLFGQMLANSGADSVWIDPVGNVIALRKGTKGERNVALDAHLDTVFPEGTDVQVRAKGDTLYAPGIGDDTRGLVMVASILRAMEQSELETEDNILFIGTVGEEGLGDLRGVKYLFSNNSIRIDSWISIDGGAIGRVNNKGLGSHRYRVTFKGPGGHSWGAFGLANPQHALGSAIHKFTEAADAYTKEGARTSYNVGRIGGGTSVNSIAFESWMEIDMRSESPERLNEMDEILKTAVIKALDYQNSIKRRGPDITVQMQKIGDRPSGELSSDLPLIQRSLAATKHFGVDPRLTRGSTNSNIPISMNIPAITIGRGGRGGGAHSLGEWWYDDEGYKAIQLALLTLVSEAGLAK